VLVESGVVGGKRVTSWPTLETDIRNAGGEWTDEEVVVDGNIITSRKPDDIPAFQPRDAPDLLRGARPCLTEARRGRRGGPLRGGER
jgi:deglycase